MNPISTYEEDPGLDGPDYVALVIEWDDLDDDEEVTAVSSSPRRAAPLSAVMRHPIATAVGALAALAFATWGLRRLQTAS
jgi:hypothetical protein